jgi:hypothetical protein
MPDIAPFRQGALIYFRKGWQDIFPVGRRGGPRYAKDPVPTGVTGYAAPAVGFERIARAVDQPAGLRNLGIRMPRTVICLDVDEYDGHGGLATLAAAEADLGPLPPTYRNSARGFTASGHRYFRCPLNHISKPGAEEILAKAYGPNIEILHYGRRYAVAWPSLNPAAGYAPYLWYDPDGQPLDEPPRVWDLPTLPPAWAELLTAPLGSEESRRTDRANLRTVTPRESAPAAGDDDLFDDPRQPWRRSVAESKAADHLGRVLTMTDGTVNKTLGSAGIVYARLAEAGLFTAEQAMELLTAATGRNGVHSDTWNRRHNKKWTLRSRLSDAFGQGLAKPPIMLIDDQPATDVYAQLLGLTR